MLTVAGMRLIGELRLRSAAYDDRRASVTACADLAAWRCGVLGLPLQVSLYQFAVVSPLQRLLARARARGEWPRALGGCVAPSSYPFNDASQDRRSVLASPLSPLARLHSAYCVCRGGLILDQNADRLAMLGQLPCLASTVAQLQSLGLLPLVQGVVAQPLISVLLPFIIGTVVIGGLLPRPLLVGVAGVMRLAERAGVLASPGWDLLEARAGAQEVGVLGLRQGPHRLHSASLLHCRELLVIDADGVVLAGACARSLTAVVTVVHTL